MKKTINISARCVEGAKKSAKSAKKAVKKISLTAIVAGACANAGLSDLEAQAAQKAYDDMKEEFGKTVVDYNYANPFLKLFT